MNKLSLKILLAFGVRGAGAVVGLLMSLVITRSLSIDGAGLFFLGLTIVTVFSIIAGLGYQDSIQRLISVYSEKNQWSEVNSIYSTALSYVAIVSFIAVAVFLFFNSQISNLIGKQDFSKVLVNIIPALFFVTLYTVQARALQALKLPKSAIFILNISTPLFFILMMFLFEPSMAQDAALMYTVSVIITFILSSFLWWRNESASSIGAVKFDTYKINTDLWVVAISKITVIWGVQLIAGFFLDHSDFAKLAVSNRVSVVVAFVLIAGNMVITPQFSILWKDNKIKQLKEFAQKSTFLISLIALPLFLLGVLFSEQILSLFGSEFREASVLLQVLLFGQLVNAISGSVSNILIMTGHENSLKKITLIFGFFALIMPLIFIPMWGVLSAAWLTSAIMVSQNLFLLYVVKRRVGFWMIGFPKAKWFIS